MQKQLQTSILLHGHAISTEQENMRTANLPQERRQNILEDLHINGKVIAIELSERYSVSEDTIRRDLRQLASTGMLKRVHGGALPLAPSSAPYTVREKVPSPTKEILACAAADLVQDGQLIIFGGGTTNAEIAKHLAVNLRATAVTASPQIALYLAQYQHLEVILVGGRLNKMELVATDAEAVAQMRRFQADICFLGVCSIHPEAGVTANLYEETSLSHAIIEQSGDIVATVTANKLDTVAPFLVSSIDEITHIITESQVTDVRLAPYRARGIRFLKAG
jgi:DeoR/GlpR family transcriptional regulator of sugar metabolism